MVGLVVEGRPDAAARARIGERLPVLLAEFQSARPHTPVALVVIAAPDDAGFASLLAELSQRGVTVVDARGAEDGAERLAAHVAVLLTAGVERDARVMRNFLAHRGADAGARRVDLLAAETATAVRTSDFAELDAFNRDAAAALAEPGAVPATGAASPVFAAALYAADALATRAQHRSRVTRAALQVCGILASLCAAMFYNARHQPLLALPYVALALGAWLIRSTTLARSPHVRHLEYRSLAEGLRTIGIWHTIGADGFVLTSTGPASRLRSMDFGAPWIREAILGLQLLVPPRAGPIDPAVLERVRAQWLGQAEPLPESQLAYQLGAVRRRQRSVGIARASANTNLFFGLGAALVIAFVPYELLGTALVVLMAIAGALPVLAGAIAALYDSPSNREIIRRSERMVADLRFADLRLQIAQDDAERREVLTEIGLAAIAELAAWHAVSRQRMP